MTSYSKPLFSGLCVMLMISLLPVHTAADRMVLQSDEGEIMVDWGSRVTKLADGTRLQGFLNSLTITEGPKQ